MRLLFIICEAGIDERIMELLHRVGAPGYTRFTGAVGHGRRGRREGSPVWPGLNSLLMVCVPEDLVDAILAGLERLEEARNGRLAVKVFSVSADEYM